MLKQVTMPKSTLPVIQEENEWSLETDTSTKVSPKLVNKKLARFLKWTPAIAFAVYVISSEPSLSEYIRMLCDLNTTFNYGLDISPNGTNGTRYDYTDFFETSTINYVEQGKLPPSEYVVERQNDIAFVITMLECPELPDGQKPGVKEGAPDNDKFYDELSILKYSTCAECGETTIGLDTFNTSLYVLVPGDAVECMGPCGQPYDRVKVLQSLGFMVEIVGPPVESDDIQSEYLRNNVERDVGIKDLIKLQAYTFTSHPVVVMIDYSTFFMKPVNPLLEEFKSSDALAAFAMDYSPYDVDPTVNNRGINTGLLVIKPSLTELENILTLYRTTEFSPETGWGGSGIKGFPGEMGTSGILTYYYSQQNQKMILDRCIYNNNAEGPYNYQGQCRDGGSTCSNCQQTPYDDIVAARLNDVVCGMPYDCPDNMGNQGYPDICTEFHRRWFEDREIYDRTYFNINRGDRRRLAFHPSRDLGFCTGPGKNNYEKLVSFEDQECDTEINVPAQSIGITCTNSCNQGEYLTNDCQCTTDECEACPEGTFCQRGGTGIPPMCIDCECGFCDYDGNACCNFNGVNNCKSATNKKECLLQNAYYPGWPGTGNACSGVEISLTATPNGCGCQPNDQTPCTYDRTLQDPEDKCFIVRGHELLTSSFAEMTDAAITTATTCRDCLRTQCNEGCVDEGGQDDKHAMQYCLGRSIGKQKESCRAACSEVCRHAATQ